MITPLTHAACTLASDAAGALASDAQAHGPLFGWARGYLFCVAAFSMFVCFVMGMTCAAGPARPGHNPWRTVGIVAAALLVIHAGYLLAPLWIGTRRGVWAMWMMLPLAAFSLLALASMLRWLPFGPREGVNVGAAWARALPKLAVVTGLYGLPPVILWWFRAR